MAAAAAIGSGLTLTGCGSKGSSEKGTLKIIVIKHSLTKPMAEMEWATKLEETAGMPIKWEEVSADWDQKKSTMLAAGDVPDLIVGTNAINDSDLATYGELFADLTDSLDSLPNVQAFFEAKPDSKNQATLPEGAIRSIPGYKRFWPETSEHQYINRPPGTSCSRSSRRSRRAIPTRPVIPPPFSPWTGARWVPVASATSSRPCS
jgi:putative aldouronate transport system substrate-binding protein